MKTPFPTASRYLVEINEDLKMAAKKNCAVQHFCNTRPRHPGEGRDLNGASGREGKIPDFAGMMDMKKGGPLPDRP